MKRPLRIAVLVASCVLTSPVWLPLVLVIAIPWKMGEMIQDTYSSLARKFREEEISLGEDPNDYH